MLPPSHIAYTLATLSELQKHTDHFQDADYRLVILAAVGPDLIDKPLAWAYFYKKYQSAVLFAHTLLAHLAILTLTLWKAPHHLIYALAFNGHAILDRLWYYHNTWYWPFRGWRFHVWHKAGGEPGDIQGAYIDAFTRRRDLWGWEIGGILALLWFITTNRLWQPKRLKHLILTGRLLLH